MHQHFGRIHDANKLADVTAIGLELAHANEVANVVENPARSLLWLYPRLVLAFARIGARDTLLDFCCWGTPWQKRTRLTGTLRDLPTIGKTCGAHWSAHCSISGKRHIPLVGKAKDGRFLTSIAQPYPPGLCDDIASLVLAGLHRGAALQ